MRLPLWLSVAACSRFRIALLPQGHSIMALPFATLQLTTCCIDKT